MSNTCYCTSRGPIFFLLLFLYYSFLMNRKLKQSFYPVGHLDKRYNGWLLVLLLLFGKYKLPRKPFKNGYDNSVAIATLNCILSRLNTKVAHKSTMDDFRFEKSKILQTCPARGSTIKTKSNNK
jgi:hypothetical protein